MFVFKTATQDSIPFPVELAGGTFTLFIVAPTMAQRLEDEGFGLELTRDDRVHSPQMFRERHLKRLERIVGWTGIQSGDGKDLPFTTTALHEVIARFPELIATLFVRLHELYAEDPKVGESNASAADSSSSSPPKSDMS